MTSNTSHTEVELTDLDHITTREDASTYNYYSTLQYYVQETPSGKLTPKLRERFHLPTYTIIVATAVIITVCSCISIIIAICVKKSTLKVTSKVLTSSNKVNHEDHEIIEPVYATISDTGNSVGEMQVDMTNNVAYKSTQFTKKSIFASVDIDVTRNEAYTLVITKR